MHASDLERYEIPENPGSINVCNILLPEQSFECLPEQYLMSLAAKAWREVIPNISGIGPDNKSLLFHELVTVADLRAYGAEQTIESPQDSSTLAVLRGGNALSAMVAFMLLAAKSRSIPIHSNNYSLITKPPLMLTEKNKDLLAEKQEPHIFDTTYESYVATLNISGALPTLLQCGLVYLDKYRQPIIDATQKYSQYSYQNQFTQA